MRKLPNDGTVDRWARERPGTIAIIDGETELTWENWNAQANALAEALFQRGLTEGDLVATRCRTRHEWAVIATAAGKLGCRLVGVNWRLTAPECEHILRDSKASALFLDDADPSGLAPLVASLGLKVAVSIDAWADGFEHYSDLVEGLAPERMTIIEASPIIYTSGTTGAPKGAFTPAPRTPEEIKIWNDYLADADQYYQPTPDDVVLVTMPVHHAGGPMLIRRAIRQGHRLVIMRRFEPEEALRLIEKHGVSSWNNVPTMLNRIASLPEDVQSRYDVSSVHHVMTGGSPVHHSIRLWANRFFNQALVIGYGGTEFGMISMLASDQIESRPNCVGRLFTNVHVKIRDAEGNDLPVGKTGDIWVLTPSNISGYVNQGPLGSDTLDSGGFFNTGDQGYLDDENFLYITDRSKDMIISGGVNIYPAEIEAAIVEHPSVLDAAVIGVPDPEWGESVFAYCELVPGRSLNEADLRAFCVDRLASYKRPRRIEFVTELPRNTVGKVLKRTLREPHWQSRELEV